MFTDPFSAVMALILLSFVGTLAVFFRIWRELESLRRSLEEVRKSMQYYAVDAAQQNRDLASLIRERRTADQSGAEGGDCLGELLERGLPNLRNEEAPVAATASDSSFSSGRLPDLAPRETNEEDEFLRRFEGMPGKGPAS